jgi:hypothetical protein
MDLAGKYVVVWLSAEAVETFLGVLEPSADTAMTPWTVAGQIVGEGARAVGPREARASAHRRGDAAARGAGLLSPMGAGDNGALVRRAAGGRAADRVKGVGIRNRSTTRAPETPAR